jgi:hypothetical protein
MPPHPPQHASPKAAPRRGQGRPDIAALVADHLQCRAPRLRRLWDYYRNPARPHAAGNPPRGSGGLAQAEGLPDRLQPRPGREREVVIENDIAWRVDVLVDFMFGRPPVIRSLAPDPVRTQRLTDFLRAVFEASGGVGLWQDTALLGTVYGHVDLLLNLRPMTTGNLADPAQAAAHFRVEPIDAQRGVPQVADDDYRRLTGYLVLQQDPGTIDRPGLLARLRPARETIAQSAETVTHWSEDSAAVYTRRGKYGGYRPTRRVANRLGRVPVVHIQNLPQPLVYGGLSEVEPLIPLQDELNTRMSDRANRVTLQAFKMYLGRGIEQFTERPVSPGQMWHTDNPDASIQEFGGDVSSPSEDAHILEVRDALDKTSGVSPVAAGVLRGKVGNLTSQNAIRLVLLGLLTRVERKRVTYGGGIERMCELILHAADVHGVLPNTPDERRVRIDWPDPVPENRAEQLELAERKIALGVPREQVLSELGYGDCETDAA